MINQIMYTSQGNKKPDTSNPYIWSKSDKVLKFSFCLNPLATILALYLCNIPLTFNLFMKIHTTDGISSKLKSTTIQVLLDMIEGIFSLIVQHQNCASWEDTISLYDQDLCQPWGYEN